MSSAYQYSALMDQYQRAHRDMGVSAWISNAERPRFYQREVELRKMDISPRSYARFVISAYLGWCQSKGMGKVPANIFLGKAVLRRYLDEQEATGRDDIGTMDQSHFLVQCEAMVAASYIQATLEGSTVSQRHIADMLRHGLPDQWWTARTRGQLAEHKSEIIGMFRDVYRLNGVKLESYNDIVVALLTREG